MISYIRPLALGRTCARAMATFFRQAATSQGSISNSRLHAFPSSILGAVCARFVSRDRSPCFRVLPLRGLAQTKKKAAERVVIWLD